ncbi:MAG: hypothetical protein NTW16_11875 [Bacteroidetes bacterium]|nr:hypothetical protein [Bacteroidota bacterium]
MKYIFAALLFLHGAIHLMGFTKAFGYARIENIPSEMSKVSGLFWLVACVLFLAAGIAFLAKADWWYLVAFVALLLSTFLIISVWKDGKFGTIANIIILAGAIIGYGTSSFYHFYQREVNLDLTCANSLHESLLTEKDLLDVPEPVKKYIRYTGSIGKPKVNNFRIEFSGKIRKDEQSPWMPFTSEQYNFLDAAARFFFLKAVMKGLPVAGFHCFKNGDAFMDIRLLSLFKVQYQSGKEMGISETVTFFNDMCCMAPATLIDKRIKWLDSDSSSVNAEFSNNGITISARLYFNDKGELVNFISKDRYAAGENNTMQLLPWSTPLKEYREVDGYRLSTSAETVYSYPEGDLCYGTFSLRHITYNN